MDKTSNLHLIDRMPWQFARGNKNAIIDVRDVKVCHLTALQDENINPDFKAKITSGLTAILPPGMEKEKRYFFGFSGFKYNFELTGYAVTEDFCYLNSPIVLANPHNIGGAYNAVLTYGFSLGRSELWPPLVLSVDDSYLNESSQATFAEPEILKALHNASDLSIEEGSVGIGTCLRALNRKGGVGSSSRVVTFGEREGVVGALVATNFGNTLDSEQRSEGQSPIDFFGQKGSLTLVLATDIPLLPLQIKQIVITLIQSLPPTSITKGQNDAKICLLFSTSNAMSMKDSGPKIFEYETVSENGLESVIRAGSEAAKEAILRSLCLSEPLQGRTSGKIDKMSEMEFIPLLKAFAETV